MNKDVRAGPEVPPCIVSGVGTALASAAVHHVWCWDSSGKCSRASCLVLGQLFQVPTCIMSGVGTALASAAVHRV